MNIQYKGQEMVVFHQMRVGRFRLAHAALAKEVDTIQSAWRNRQLGALFTVTFIPDQVIGEEIHDAKGRLVAVFGAALSNAFVPNPKPQQEYLNILASVLSQTPKSKEAELTQ